MCIIIEFTTESDGKVWSVCIHKVNWIMCVSEIWPFEFVQNGRRPPSWMPSGNGAVRSAVPEKPPYNQTQSGPDYTVLSHFHLKFSKMCELALRSVVNIHTSYTDLINSLCATSGT